MIDANHTPGPWHIKDNGHARARVFYVAENGYPGHIANCIHNGQANARLIAAAPDMLEELRDALLALEANHVEPKLQETIRQTIAKATGAE